VRAKLLAGVWILNDDKFPRLKPVRAWGKPRGFENEREVLLRDLAFWVEFLAGMAESIGI
jgi:hypothetical protein